MQSSSQIITTNKPTSSIFTGRMPFLLPNQQRQNTEGKISHSMDLHTPSSPGVFQLCLWPLIAPGCLGRHASHQPSDASTPVVKCLQVTYFNHTAVITQWLCRQYFYPKETGVILIITYLHNKINDIYPELLPRPEHGHNPSNGDEMTSYGVFLYCIYTSAHIQPIQCFDSVGWVMVRGSSL